MQFMKSSVVAFIAILLLCGNYTQARNAGTRYVGSNEYRRNYQRVATSTLHTLEIRNGALYAYGSNANGQLGDGTTTNRTSPVQIGSATNWVSVSTGSNSSFGIRADGTLWAWGLNTDGQLGIGSTTNQNAPIQVGSGTNWVAVAAGAWDHTIALKADGTLWATGLDNDGQLGNGAGISSSTSFVQVGSSTDWVAISAGYSTNLAIKADGTLWAWGRNGSGQIGDGTTTQKDLPTQVGSDNKWVSISSGEFFSMGLKVDGTLWTWGNNLDGVLARGIYML
jgi:alpha-tubulin suppressor-like RCC1 family protein